MKKQQILIAVLASFSLLSLSGANALEYTIEKLIGDLQTLDAGDKITSEVVVQTDKETHIFPSPDSNIQANLLVLQQNRCGYPGPTVIYVQPAGGYEYRWCMGEYKVKAFMDIWIYINGSPQPMGSMDVLCSAGWMPAPVRAIVCTL